MPSDKPSPPPRKTPPAPAGGPEPAPRLYARRQPTGRESILNLWRGVDLQPEEIARKPTEQRAGDVVGRVVKRLRLEQRQSETEIVKVWNNLMDANVAKHAQPVSINKGTLFVTVDSSVWLDEIVRYRRKEILTRLQTAFGRELIQRISFRVG